MRNAKNEMEGKRFVAKMPFTIAPVLYFIVWFPFAVLCLPIVLVAAIGQIFSH